MKTKEKIRAYLEIQERRPNSYDWFCLEQTVNTVTTCKPSNYAKFIGIMYQWKEKNPEYDYRIVLMQETVLVIAE